ncbi:hypothetical protein C8Q80DRAFT_1105254 [Daedaleopsis nitida]|nr:hypothetical protein C8Q80DRAFT_1105254 [Daedaleopsis nitida]
MPPRRHRSTSNVQRAQFATPPPHQRSITPAAPAQPQHGIPPAVYQSNMKVLLRREPSITSICDQFSYVCLYHFDGQRWQKHGYEGSMFIFEKSTYPTYGFYILNRMGAEDYVRSIYPEDDMDIKQGYLMYRFYPDYTQTRLDMGLPYPIPEQSREAFHAELTRRMAPELREKDKDKEKRGKATTVGLWMSQTDSREPMKEVMMRLHTYIKQGLPYPEEFRYYPGRPPHTQHLRTASRASVQEHQVIGAQTAPPDGIAVSHSAPSGAPATNESGSELDKLFAKLVPPSTSAPILSPPTPASSTSGSSSRTVHDLLAALGGNPATNQQSVMSSQPAPPSSVDLLPTGHSLLNMMFASASQPGPSSSIPTQHSSQPLPSQPDEIVIVSPKPTSSALPQILNQDVLHSLMGLAPDSRASSAAPSSVGSRRSAQHRYEGDNEYSEEDLTSEGEYSKSNVVRTVSNTRSIPTFAVPQAPSSESEAESARKTNDTRRVAGDVTPRPPTGGMRLPPTSPPQFLQRTATPNANGKVNGNGTASPALAANSAPRQRQLVPFEANSDLWPYPRAPLDERSFEQDDVVELDFADTRALSDPAIFSSRLKEKKEKKEKGKKSRKEREKEREKEKAEIEKGWDIPTQTQGQPAYQQSVTGPVAQAATTPAKPQVVKAPKPAKKAVANGQSQEGALNGAAAKEAILAAMSAAAPGQIGIAKNDFVRELLTLIHTDSKFVDNLWQDYTSRAA